MFEIKNNSLIPLFEATISAGFPSAADHGIQEYLDLNRHLVKHPAATFFVKVEGDSMILAGIHSGDTLIVDKALEAKSGNVIVAIYNGEFTVKRLLKKDDRLFLIPENPRYPQLEIKEESEFCIWGVVTYVLHPLR